MGELIVTCNVCDKEITKLTLGPETTHDALFWATRHLEEKHSKEELAAYLRDRPRGAVFWRSTVK